MHMTAPVSNFAGGLSIVGLPSLGGFLCPVRFADAPQTRLASRGPSGLLWEACGAGNVRKTDVEDTSPGRRNVTMCFELGPQRLSLKSTSHLYPASTTYMKAPLCM